jgi:hypothetical protein
MNKEREALQKIVKFENSITNIIKAKHLATEALQSESEWISVEDRLPEVKYNKYGDHSDNVLAWCNGELMVLCLSEVDGEDGGYAIVWCNCYGRIDSDDAEFDDEYKPTHWMPLPQAPSIKTPKI